MTLQLLRVYGLIDQNPVEWNPSAFPTSKIILGASRTFDTPTPIEDGATYTLYVQQDTTGGRTITWPGIVVWLSGSPPTLTSAANAVTIIQFYSDGTTLYGAPIGLTGGTPSGPEISVGIVPFPGGGQADATPVNYGYNLINLGDDFNTGDSLQLPSAVAGSVVQVFTQGNTGNDNADMYAKNGTTDVINLSGNGDAFFIGTNPASAFGCVFVFLCVVDGQWWTNASTD